jgi:phosphoribosylformylglycinamidine synthase
LTQVVVNVHLKNEILDPQGRAILTALKSFDLEGVKDVRQGKQIKITLEDDLTPQRLNKINQLAKDLLSNPIIEDFTIEVKK